MAMFAEHVKKPYIIQNFVFYIPILIRFLTIALDFDFRNISHEFSEIQLLHNVKHFLSLSLVHTSKQIVSWKTSSFDPRPKIHHE
jgi:hypothetical protein